jgi:thiamine-phosphate pyrophosphorylase
MPMKNKILPHGVYAITAEQFSHGRKNTVVVRAMAEGGAKVIQYRQKLGKTPREMLDECREIRKITRDYGVIFIVNDYIDIAILSDADGIHLGQDDLPISEVRRLAPEMMIGVSTHSPEQAQAALRDGADYIGVGPLYETHTKTDVIAPVGVGYLEYIALNIGIPYVAIGGIKMHNLRDVLERGAKTVAMVTEIVEEEDIARRVREIRRIMEEYGITG